MTAYRGDVARVAAQWSHIPEGGAGSPMYRVLFTPAALLAFMDANGLGHIDADMIGAPVPVLSDRLGAGVPDDAATVVSESPRPSEGPSGS